MFVIASKRVATGRHSFSRRCCANTLKVSADALVLHGNSLPPACVHPPNILRGRSKAISP